MISEPLGPRSTGNLEQIGLYNILNRVVRGDQDFDALVLLTLRQRGLIAVDTLALTEAGAAELMRLAQELGWFYPEV